MTPTRLIKPTGDRFGTKLSRGNRCVWTIYPAIPLQAFEPEEHRIDHPMDGHHSHIGRLFGQQGLRTDDPMLRDIGTEDRRSESRKGVMKLEMYLHRSDD